MEVRWRKVLLVVDYNLSVKESYFAICMQPGNISFSFMTPIEEVRKVLLDKAY